jgi:hypothetical protein
MQYKLFKVKVYQSKHYEVSKFVEDIRDVYYFAGVCDERFVEKALKRMLKMTSKDMNRFMHKVIGLLEIELQRQPEFINKAIFN